MTHITMIAPYYVPYPGGQEVHTMFLIKKLLAYNLQISLITTNHPKNKTYEKMKNLEIIRLKLQLEIYNNPFCFLLFFKLMKIKTDLFHVQGYWSLFANIAAIVAKIRNIPLIYTSHGFQSQLYQKNLITRMIVVGYLKTFGIFMFNQMRKMTLNHNEDKEILLKCGIDNNKMEIIPSGLDVYEYFKAEKTISDIDLMNFKEKYQLKKPVILYIGRLVERKGCHFLLYTVPELLKKYPDLKCLIVGDGPELDRFMKLAKNLNIENNIVFFGYLKPFSKTLILCFKSATIQILPSLTESMPVSVMEGMLFEKPIMITDLHFAKWISYNNENLYIPINPLKTKEFTQKIIQLLEDENLQKYRAKMGRKLVLDNLNWDINAQKILHLYQKEIMK